MEGVLSQSAAIDYIAKAFVLDYDLSENGGAVSHPFGTALFNEKKLDFNAGNPIRQIISTYHDYAIAKNYPGTSIDDWIDYDYSYREMLIEELESFEDRKKAAIAKAKELAKKEGTA